MELYETARVELSVAPGVEQCVAAGMELSETALV